MSMPVVPSGPPRRGVPDAWPIGTKTARPTRRLQSSRDDNQDGVEQSANAHFSVARVPLVKYAKPIQGAGGGRNISDYWTTPA
jgi:hypothetical protein